MRSDGRMPDEVRAVKIQREFTCYAPGSVLIEVGRTRVICTAMVDNRVPPHCLQENKGWLTAEYAMLPSASPDRKSLHAPPDGRAQEIQRLVGRALRCAVDLHRLAGRTIWVDCNVIQADGGTRAASITGGYVALVDALWSLRDSGALDCMPLLGGVVAVSVGIVEGRALVDLTADEDRAASVDMNLVIAHDGRFIEIQGTAEGEPFDRAQHDEMIALASAAAEKLKQAQVRALAGRLAT